MDSLDFLDLMGQQGKEQVLLKAVRLIKQRVEVLYSKR